MREDTIHGPLARKTDTPLRQGIVLLVMLSLLGLQACQEDPEYEELSFTKLSTPPIGFITYVGPDRIELPSGILQAVEAEVEYEGDRYLIGSFIDLDSQNENNFVVIPMAKKNQYLLIGRNPGQTCMNVTVNGERKECILVTVE